MNTHTRTVVAAVFAAISVLIVSSASAEVTKATVDTNAIRSALKGVPPVELSAKAAKIVSKAEQEKQVLTAVETMRVVVKKNPAVVVTVASAIAKVAPKAAPAVAAVGAELVPEYAEAIAKATALAAPGMADYIAVEMAAVLPRKAQRIVSVINAAVPLSANKIALAQSTRVSRSAAEVVVPEGIVGQKQVSILDFLFPEDPPEDVAPVPGSDYNRP